MHQQLEALVECSNPKEFAAQFKTLTSSYASTDLFLEDLARTLAPRLYEPFYDGNPTGFYGITCASLAEPLFAPEKRWRPYAQQAWALRKIRKRIPLALPEDADPGPAPDWTSFVSALESSNFAVITAVARAFLCRADLRQGFRGKLALLALEDCSLGGHKFNYMVQSWLLAERLGFRASMDILAGPLHLMAFTPREPVSGGPLTRSRAISRRQGKRDPRREGQDALLFGSADEAASQMSLRAEESQGAVTDFLRLGAAQVIANAARGKWLPALRAFHTAYLATECADWFEPEDRPKAMHLVGLLINRASVQTRETDRSRMLDESIRDFCPTDPFGVLRSVISHSDPFASAVAAYAIVGMDEPRKEELATTLMAQAVKNDGDIAGGHDILSVTEAWNCYRRSNSESRGLFFGATAYYLGQLLKNYSLAAEYGV